ncbi:uncharacterized protein A1O9_04964 [Exophiala aquamarina CBS 119918]|uniref:Uncharacterized protein n=1 Tax=Exophiala aquamarina CBS 119918 TaxID=1182545 RepID=A0A072PJ03_9EURO|nr:uncharacterized protein A1O9_04964 [Exophiala aquamarina CBS 119918]KEF60114.1 hypothetical protein A1O9_04964 [Exophiala aquamarina CBS 119918]
MSTSKPKAMLKHSKGKKKSEQTVLREFILIFPPAGVDLEEAAGKWRAGDAVKSMRFFTRAVETYDQGLRKFPSSLDLAYNKARVLLEVATHPILVNQLQTSVLEALQRALEAHRYALDLDQNNADSLFNTSQVLTGIAEIQARDGADQEALQTLEQALEVQTRCLALQELKLEDSAQQQANLEAQTDQDFATANSPKLGGSDHALSTATNDSEDQWFSIVEPVTKDTLIDTILAQLGTLTTLCSILSSLANSTLSSSLAWVEEFSTKLVKTKLPVLLQEAAPDRVQEVALTRAIFISNLLEAGYRMGSIDVETYKRERDDAFKSSELSLDGSFAALSANASSLISFSTAIKEREQPLIASYAPKSWNALSTAMASLAAAAKIAEPVPDEIAETHLLRGNCSLLQYQLGQPPVSYQTATKNADQLLKNADVFYRNASKLFQDGEQKLISQFRASVAQSLQEGNVVATAAHAAGQQKGQAWIESQLDDMAEEGIISLAI